MAIPDFDAVAEVRQRLLLVAASSSWSVRNSRSVLFRPGRPPDMDAPGLVLAAEHAATPTRTICAPDGNE
ncbi:MAG TPA: hypothetical protein VLB69_01880 [Rudaea sp.]|nr:hypothetical protein [Rudaea sp.]